MIIKVRSPTMRHVSLAHRVALDRLFDRINLDPKIQSKHVDTKNQLAEMLTKGNFTRDEWNHLLRLFNIMSLSMFSCGHFRPPENPKTMSKRTTQAKEPGEILVVAKSKPTLSLVSRSVHRSPMLDSGVSYGPRNDGMQCQNSDRSRIEKSTAPQVKDVNENTTSSSQVWHQNENTRTSIEKSMAKADQRSSMKKSMAKMQNRLTETRLTHHNFEIFNVPYFEKVFPNVRKKLSRREEDQTLDLKVNGIIWEYLCQRQ